MDLTPSIRKVKIVTTETMTDFNPLFEVSVSVSRSVIYTFNTLAEALRFAEKADGTIHNEYNTVLRRGSWDDK